MSQHTHNARDINLYGCLGQSFKLDEIIRAILSHLNCELNNRNPIELKPKGKK